MRAARPSIVLVNRSNGLVADATMLKITAALQRQVSIDFGRAWGHDATITCLRAGSRQGASPLAWQVVLLQHEAHAAELGYRDLTPQGKPLATVLCEDNEDEISVAVSKEVLAMLLDPSMCGFEHRKSDGMLCAREACSPVAGSTYRIAGILVSDFVLPAFFVEGSDGPFDQMRVLQKPLMASESGYLPTLDPQQGDWLEGPPVAPGSRTARRLAALRGELAESDKAVSAPLAAPAKADPRIPARRPENQARPAPAARIFRENFRQPNRGTNVLEERVAKVPLRQPLRGIKAELAAAAPPSAVGAPAAARSPVSSDRDSFTEPSARPLPPANDRPPPAPNPLRAKKAPPAVAAIPAPATSPLRDPARGTAPAETQAPPAPSAPAPAAADAEKK